MKKPVIASLLLLALAGVAQAMPCPPSHPSFYSQRYQFTAVPMGRVFVRCDNWGNTAGFQRVRIAQWQQVSGGCQVMVKTRFGWRSQWQNGHAWQMNWVEQIVRVW